jgi:8-hydroxy-5-deazaflavin:NADPH oxidoreductase
MKIGILGAGNLGSAIAKRLLGHKHQVLLSFARDETAMTAFAASIGAQSGTPSDAVRFGDVLILAAPWTAVPDALRQAGTLDGKIIWDCTNPLNADLTGLLLGTITSAGEEVARMAPTAKVVKAIPPFAELLQGADIAPDKPRPSTFVCGDDATAKRTVSELVELLGAEAVDSGPLSAARFAEPAGMLLVHLAYKQGLGGRIGTGLLRFP